MALLAGLLLCVLLVVGASWVTWTAAERRHSVRLRTAKARWDAAAALRSTTERVCESFTTGWLNVLLWYLWPGFLEKEVSGLFARRIAVLLRRLLLSAGQRGPMRLVESIQLEEFTLGSVPPRFSTCKARYTAEKSYLQFELGMDFTTSGSQAVLTPRMKETGLKTRVKFSHLAVKGRLLLGLQLGTLPPGITGLHFSFVDTPEVDFQIRPMGVALTEIPGVMNYLRDALMNAIQRLMVEPRHTFTDFHAMFSRLRAERQGGPGGLLVVTVLAATGLAAKAPASRPDAYCEMRASSEVFRTPTASEAHSPCWKWQFECRLPAPLGSGCWAEELIFSVYDAKALGDAQQLGHCKVRLQELELVANAAPIDVHLPLTSPTLPSASLHLGLQLLQRSAVAVQPVPSAVAPVDGVANQTQRSALIPADTSITWQSPQPPPRPPWPDESARVKELAAKLDSEKLSRLAAERQFNAMAKESARLRELLKPQSVGAGHHSHSPSLRGARLSSSDPAGSPSALDELKAGSKQVEREQPPLGKLYEAALRRPPMSPEQEDAPVQRSPNSPRPGLSLDVSPIAASPAREVPSEGTAPRMRALDLTHRRRSVSDCRGNTAEGGQQQQQQQQLGVRRHSASLDDIPARAKIEEAEELAPRAIFRSECDDDEHDGTEADAVGHGSTFVEYSSHSESEGRFEDADGTQSSLSQERSESRPPPASSSIQLLMKIAALESKLESERAKHASEKEVILANVAKLEEELASEYQRRLYEELRALAEGAKFRIHRASGVQVRHVWYSAQERALMWRANKAAMSKSNGRRSGGEESSMGHQPSSSSFSPNSWEESPSEEQVVSRLVLVKQISKIVEGVSLFPSSKKQPLLAGGFQGLLTLRSLGGMAGSGASSSATKEGSREQQPDPRKSFSVVFTNNTAIHLEIPPGGNGRSQAEWASALENLRQNRLEVEGAWGGGASPQKRKSAMKII